MPGRAFKQLVSRPTELKTRAMPADVLAEHHASLGANEAWGNASPTNVTLGLLGSAHEL